MIAILIEAQDIADGTTVCKVGGDKEYTVQRKFKIHGTEFPEFKAEGGVLLVGHGSVNFVADFKVLKVPFEDIQEAITFLQEVCNR